MKDKLKKMNLLEIGLWSVGSGIIMGIFFYLLQANIYIIIGSLFSFLTYWFVLTNEALKELKSKGNKK